MGMFNEQAQKRAMKIREKLTRFMDGEHLNYPELGIYIAYTVVCGTQDNSTLIADGSGSDVLFSRTDLEPNTIKAVFESARQTTASILKEKMEGIDKLPYNDQLFIMLNKMIVKLKRKNEEQTKEIMSLRQKNEETKNNPIISELEKEKKRLNEQLVFYAKEAEHFKKIYSELKTKRENNGRRNIGGLME